MGRHVPPSGTIDSLRSRVRRLSATIALDPHERYAAYKGELNGLNRALLYTPEYGELVGRSIVGDVIGTPWRASGATHPLDVMLDVDTQTYLPDDLLVKMDIATMASSLEGRSPLLDHELMEFAASLPPELKIRGTEKKVALRGALRGWVPDQILDAPKRGFCVPLADWLRGELREYATDVLLDPRTTARGYFRESYVRDMLDRHVRRVEDRSAGIWTLLMFELWHRELADRPPGATVPTGSLANAAPQA
jgi:asparagine synthase (glutamine-hydrolysing)